MTTAGAAQLPSYVPQQYAGLVLEAAAGTGLPPSVVAAQVNDESGFDPRATSGAGAEGMFQFIPSTYQTFVNEGLVPAGSEYNPTEEVKAYTAYMSELLHQEGGSVYRALEAYNAGPGNLGAGAGYASSILSAAGASQSLSSGGGSGKVSGGGAGIPGTGTVQASLTGFPVAPFLGGVLGSLFGDPTAAIGAGASDPLGIGALTKTFQLAALMVPVLIGGAALVVIGMAKATSARQHAQQAAGAAGKAVEVAAL